MTEIFGLFDAADPEAPDRVYTSEAFARLFKTMMRDGIVHNDGDELAVSPSVPAAMSVSVGTGMALVQGRYYINDGDLTLPVDAADPSHPRIDRVVVRLEATPGRTVHAVVKKGTPAPSPVPPGLTRTAETWELSLAQVRVEAGATSIVAGKITDERGNTSLCGVAAPVYVPSSQVEAVGVMNMQGHALTGLPAPSAGTDAARKDMGGATLQNLGAPVNANDAARKADVDSAIGGFGISQVAIDADKNWNGKNITNLGKISPKTWLVVTGADPLLISKSHASSTTVTFTPQLDGTGHIKVVAAGASVDRTSGTREFTVLKNGSPIWTESQKSEWGGEWNYFPAFTETAFEDLSIASGDTLTLSRTGGSGAVTLKIYSTPLVAPYGIVS
jgi:hypothetical protein